MTRLHQLIIYRNILKDTVLKKIISLSSNTENPTLTYELCAELLKKGEKIGLRGNIIKNYIIYLIFRDENIFSTMVDKAGHNLGKSLCQAVAHDIAILQEVFNGDLTATLAIPPDVFHSFDPTYRSNIPGFARLQAYFETLGPVGVQTPEQLVNRLIEYYLLYGSGDMAFYKAFHWEKEAGLQGIRHFDQTTIDDIIGCEYQKQVLIDNTEAFLDDRPANNILLAGSRGTGKSSLVKALANKYFLNGLRLVEISKHELVDLPKIMSALRNYGKKFIIFIDDLSFEEFEIEYKYLKSAIEGGAESKPDNVLIYATSNRRHLIKESWNERQGDADDLHFGDAVNEKISLSDRFGITLTFIAPDQKQYFTIIEEIAKKNNLKLSPDELRKEALKWEMSHSGRSGRSARQFVTHLMSAGPRNG